MRRGEDTVKPLRGLHKAFRATKQPSATSQSARALMQLLDVNVLTDAYRTVWDVTPIAPTFEAMITVMKCYFVTDVSERFLSEVCPKIPWLSHQLIIG